MTPLHVELREWQVVGVGTPDEQGLRGFHFRNAADRRVAERLTQQNLITFIERYDGLRIVAGAHIGRLQFEGLAVSVTPKLAASDLLALVRYAYRLRDVRRVETASHSMTGRLLEELLVAQLAEEVRALLDRGIARTYVRRDEELESPRGRIDFARLAASSAPARIGLPCHYYSRDTDHLLNRAVLAGLSLARQRSFDEGLRFSVARLQQRVSRLARELPISVEMLQRAKQRVTRLEERYESILTLVELLYRGSLLDLQTAPEAQQLPGFLFDMNRFFQRLMLRFLEDNLEPPLRAQGEYSLRDMFAYVPDEVAPGRRAPTPRADFAILRRGTVVALADAKYRDLWTEPLPREMLYQLTIYALSQRKGATATILYPTTDSSARQSRIEVRDPTSGQMRAYVAMKPVLLARMVQLVAKDDANALTTRAKWSKELALAGDERIA